MAADLEDARTKLAWAEAQREALDQQLRVFFSATPYRFVADTHPNWPAGKIYRFQMRAAVPRAAVATLGFVLKAQRESLDNLACALAERNGADDPRDVYFPITDDAVKFSQSGMGKIRRLSANDQAKIAGLKPYRGGGGNLWALHQLANKDKHRKLLTVPVSLGDAFEARGAEGSVYLQRAAIFMPDNRHFPGQSFVLVEANGQGAIEFSLSARLIFEDSQFTTLPVMEALGVFNREVTAIINMFD